MGAPGDLIGRNPIWPAISRVQSVCRVSFLLLAGYRSGELCGVVLWANQAIDLPGETPPSPASPSGPLAAGLNERTTVR